MEHSGFAPFVDEPPIIEITSGIARISYHHQAIERVMSVRNLARSVQRAQTALKRHAAGEENVIVDE